MSIFNAVIKGTPADPSFSVAIDTPFILIPVNQEGYTTTSVTKTISMSALMGSQFVSLTISDIQYNTYNGEVSATVVGNDVVCTFRQNANFLNTDTDSITIELDIDGQKLYQTISWAKIKSGKDSWNLLFQQPHISLQTYQNYMAKAYNGTIKFDLIKGSTIIDPSSIEQQPITVVINGVEVPYAPNTSSTTSYVGSDRVEVYITIDPTLASYLTQNPTDQFAFDLNIPDNTIDFTSVSTNIIFKVIYYSKFYDDKLTGGTLDPAPIVAELTRNLDIIPVTGGEDAFNVAAINGINIFSANQNGYITDTSFSVDFKVTHGAFPYTNVSIDSSISSLLPSWITYNGLINNSNGDYTVNFGIVSNTLLNPQTSLNGSNITIPVVLTYIDASGITRTLTYNVKSPWAKTIIPEIAPMIQSDQNVVMFDVQGDGRIISGQEYNINIKGFDNSGNEVEVYAPTSQVIFNPPVSGNNYDWIRYSSDTDGGSGSSKIGTTITIQTRTSTTLPPDKGTITFPIYIKNNTYDSTFTRKDYVLTWNRNRSGEDFTGILSTASAIIFDTDSYNNIIAQTAQIQLSLYRGITEIPMQNVSVTGLPTGATYSVTYSPTVVNLNVSPSSVDPDTGELTITAEDSGGTSYTRKIPWMKALRGINAKYIIKQVDLIMAETDTNNQTIGQIINDTIYITNGVEKQDINSITVTNSPSWITIVANPPIVPNKNWTLVYTIAPGSVIATTNSHGMISFNVATASDSFDVSLPFTVNASGKDGISIVSSADVFSIPFDGTDIQAYSIDIFIRGFQGTMSVLPVVSNIQNIPTGMSIAQSNESDSVKLSITVSAGATLGGANAGLISMDVAIGSLTGIVKSISWSVVRSASMTWGIIT